MTALRRSLARESAIAQLAVLATDRITGVTLPPSAVSAAFRLFGLRSGSGQLLLLWRMLLAPRPGLRRLRQRAIRAIADYRAILAQAPHLAGLMKLDFTILLGLYTDTVGIGRGQAVDAGLVEVYCHLAALVDAYDDLLDRPDARGRPLQRAELLDGATGALRSALVDGLAARQRCLHRPADLVGDLAAFEDQALRAHLALDIGAGLHAPLETVVRARAATSGLLLRFAAHLWSVLLDLPPALATSTEQAAATFGVVAQFADDVIDWTQDDGVAQNLLGAALQAYPAELAAMRAAAARCSGWSLPYRVVRTLAPRAVADLMVTRAKVAAYPSDPRYAALRQFGDDVYAALLPALPAIDFSQLDAIRSDLQAALRQLEGPRG